MGFSYGSGAFSQNNCPISLVIFKILFGNPKSTMLLSSEISYFKSLSSQFKSHCNHFNQNVKEWPQLLL